MLKICDGYATEFCIVFNAKKSKCLVAAPRKRRYLLSTGMCHFTVGGNSIDFFNSFVHLGLVSSTLNESEDDANRHCNFIGQTNNILFFGKVDSRNKYRLLKNYCMVVNNGY